MQFFKVQSDWIVEQVEEDEKKIYLEQLRQWRDNENAVQYYAKCESVVEKLKEQYRSHAVE